MPQDIWDADAYLRERLPDVQLVEHLDLPGNVLGYVDHRRHIIWLAPGLSPVERRCALTHEIGRLVIGPPPESPYLAVMHRRAAADWAALVLVSSEALFAAAAVSSDYATMAAYLGVDLATLRDRFRGMSDAEQDGIIEALRRSPSFA